MLFNTTWATTYSKMPHPSRTPEQALAALNQAALSIASEVALDKVLQQITDSARSLVGARYAALGVPSPEGHMEKFVTSGMAAEQAEKIPHRPLGLGVLGAIMRESRSIRLPQVSDDPRAVGWPAGRSGGFTRGRSGVGAWGGSGGGWPWHAGGAGREAFWIWHGQRPRTAPVISAPSGCIRSDPAQTATSPASGPLWTNPGSLRPTNSAASTPPTMAISEFTATRPLTASTDCADMTLNPNQPTVSVQAPNARNGMLDGG